MIEGRWWYMICMIYDMWYLMCDDIYKFICYDEVIYDWD